MLCENDQASISESEIVRRILEEIRNDRFTQARVGTTIRPPKYSDIFSSSFYCFTT